MTPETGDRYQLFAAPEFEADLRRLRDAAADEQQHFPDARDPSKRVHRERYIDTLREIDRLRTGASDGHHVLGQSAGRGDGRDAVASMISSGRGRPTDRLIFREIPARNAGTALNARELLVVGPRHGPDDAYTQAAIRLGRDPHRRMPELDRFGVVDIATGGKAHERHARLGAQRAIAHAYDGQRPLATSRRLDPAQPTARPTKRPDRGVSRRGQRVE